METYPSKDERDFAGVCLSCKRFSSTIVVDRNHGDAVFTEEDWYGYAIDDDVVRDFREVTRCCGSEDFIPLEYLTKCSVCHAQVDRRRSVHVPSPNPDKKGGYVCENCINKEGSQRKGEEAVSVAMPSLPKVKPRSYKGGR